MEAARLLKPELKRNKNQQQQTNNGNSNNENSTSRKSETNLLCIEHQKYLCLKIILKMIECCLSGLCTWDKVFFVTRSPT